MGRPVHTSNECMELIVKVPYPTQETTCALKTGKRDRGRQTERERQTDRETEADRQRERGRQTETEADRQTEING